MFEMLDRVAGALEGVVGGFEPGCLTGAQAAVAVGLFDRIERLGLAGKAVAARRVEETRVWRREGFRSAAHWMAATTGTTTGQATGTLETATRLEELPATAEKFRSGELSEAQAREISHAAGACPEAEAELLAGAPTQTVSELRDACRRTTAAAVDENERQERIRRNRYLRSWTDADGAVRLDARLTPDDGARVMAALDARRQRIFKQAWLEGRRESNEAYAADALVDLATDPDGPKGVVHVHVDHPALVRGHLQPGEICEVPGVGPLPVSVVRQWAEDSFLKAVLVDGTDIKAVSHLGRTIPARLRTALETRDPTCVVPGCDVRHGLEIDHIVPFASGGPTRLDNLARLCRQHHRMKPTAASPSPANPATGPGPHQENHNPHRHRPRPAPTSDYPSDYDSHRRVESQEQAHTAGRLAAGLATREEGAEDQPREEGFGGATPEGAGRRSGPGAAPWERPEDRVRNG